MNVKFEKYWGECNLLMRIAVVLDLRNKITLKLFCFPIIDRLLTILNDLYNEYVQEYNSSVIEQNLRNSVQECLSTSSSVNVVGRNVQSGLELYESFV